MRKIYCDNNVLKENLIGSNPIKGGFAFHELEAIWLAHLGYFKTIREFSKPMQQVRNYHALLGYLQSEGLVRICNIKEYFEHLPIADSRAILNKYDAGKISRRNQALEKITSKFSLEELNDMITERLYIPTELGYQVLKNAVYSYETIKYLKEEDFIYLTDKKVIADDLFIADMSRMIISVEISGDDIRFYKDKSVLIEISMTYHCGSERNNYIKYLEPQNITIIIEDIQFVFNEVIDIIIHRKIKKLTISAAPSASDEYEGEVTYYVVDLERKSIESEEKVEKFNYFKSEQYKIQNGLRDFKHREDPQIFYVSVRTNETKLILDEFAQQNGYFEVEELKNILKEDFSDNIRIKISKNDAYTRGLLKYLMMYTEISTFEIFGLNIYSLIEYMSYLTTEKYNFCNVRREEYLQINEDIKETCDLLFQKISRNPVEIVNIIKKTSGCECISDLGFVHPNVGDISYFMQHLEPYKIEYDSIVNNLRMKGMLTAKWKSEFNLYTFVKEIYENSIFQYRALWLGKQSLDIFIPDLGIAIEYQGKQHFEPVEFFGGEDTYKKNVERDARKKKLCISKGIKLLEWNYYDDVSRSNVHKFLNDNIKGNG